MARRAGRAGCESLWRFCGGHPSRNGVGKVVVPGTTGSNAGCELSLALQQRTPASRELDGRRAFPQLRPDFSTR